MKQYYPRSTQNQPSSVSVLTDTPFYLIKLYTHENEALFGGISEGQFELNEIGQIAADEWQRSSRTCQDIKLDEWMIFPDHLIGFVSICQTARSQSYPVRSSKPRLLSSFIASYKTAAAKRINLQRNAPGSSVWQRSYQERLIPDRVILGRIKKTLFKVRTHL
ncbi:MAG: hypothetical protein ACFBSF_19965 [Leptolyngbyaceae cyanobacterium]